MFTFLLISSASTYSAELEAGSAVGLLWQSHTEEKVNAEPEPRSSQSHWPKNDQQAQADWAEAAGESHLENA
jgi:hypothetical protein